MVCCECELYFWILMGFYRCCAWPLAKISRVWPGTCTHEYTQTHTLTHRDNRTAKAVNNDYFNESRITNWLIDSLTDWRTAGLTVTIGTSGQHEQHAQLPLQLLVLPADCRRASVAPFDNHLVRQQSPNVRHFRRWTGAREWACVWGQRPINCL